MPVRFLVNGSTSPFTLPGDWDDTGHTVRLIGCGGRGGTASTGVNHRAGPGGGGGAHVLLTRTAGTLASTAFFVGVDNPSITVKTTGVATLWGSGSAFSNCRYVEAGEGGGVGGTDTAGGLGGLAATTSTGTPTVPTYTASLNQNGGNGGAVAAVSASGGGGGGAGGPSGVGGVGGASTTASVGGGGGGGGNNIGAGSNASTANGGAGGGFPALGGGAPGSGGTPAGSNATVNTGAGGGGGFFSGIAAANTHGGDGAVDDIFTQTVPTTVTGGPGGGGGGGGGNSVNTPTPITSGGNGALFGGGGGGAGGARSATSTRTAGTGASGLIVITYTQLVVTGTVAVTEPRDTAVFTGSSAAAVDLTANNLIGTAPSLLAVPLFDVSDESSGTLLVSDPVDIAEFTGTLALNAILAVIEPADNAALTGSVTRLAELAVTEPSDTAGVLGLVSLTGTLGVIEPSDTAVFIEGIFGPLAVTEAADTAVFLGTPVDHLTATDLIGPDPELLAVPAFAVTANFLAVTEPPDTAALTGLVGALNILSVTEPSDTAALTSTTAWNTILAVTEARDTAAILGTTTAVVSLEATSVVVEDPELLALPVFDAAAEFFIAGTLGVTEPSDTAAITGSTEAVSSLVATDLILDEPELLAVPAFDVIIVVSGVLAVTEAPDVAVITGTGAAVWSLTATGLVGQAPELVTPAFAAIARFDIQSATIGPPLLGRPTLVDTKIGILDVTESSDTAAFTGFLVAGPDLITVNAASVLFTGSTINLIELVGDATFVGSASVVLAGQTVGLVEREVLSVTSASVLFAGHTVIVRDGDIFPVTHATVTFTGKAVATFEGDVTPVTNAAVTFAGQNVFIDILPGHILFAGQEVLVKDSGLILGGGGFRVVHPRHDLDRKRRRRWRALEEIEKRLDQRIERLKTETKAKQQQVAEVLSQVPEELPDNFGVLLLQQNAITVQLLDTQRRADAVRRERVELAALAERAARQIDDEEAMAALFAAEPDPSIFNAAMARFVELLNRL